MLRTVQLPRRALSSAARIGKNLLAVTITLATMHFILFDQVHKTFVQLLVGRVVCQLKIKITEKKLWFLNGWKLMALSHF